MPQPPHVLQLVTGLNVYGAERVAFALAKGAARRGWRSTVGSVAAPVDAGLGATLAQELAVAGVAHLRLGPPGGPRRLQLLSAALALRGRLARAPFDLVHVHTDLPELVTALAVGPGRLKGVRTIHNTTLWPGRPRVAGFVERRLADFTPVAISDASREAWLALRANARVRRPAAVPLIRNAAGVDPSTLLPRAAAREALGIAPGARALGFVGRLVEQKGVDVLAEAVRGDDWPAGATLEVFGDGPLRSLLEDARSAGAPVRLHGARPDVSRLYPALDALLAPSRFEGAAPLAVLDALVAGIPAAATPCPGVVDDPTTAKALISIDELTPRAICVAAEQALRSEKSVPLGRDLSENAMCSAYLTLYAERLRAIPAGADSLPHN